MILTGPAIEEEIRQGRIQINPFVPEHVGPNSVDLRLADILSQYVEFPLDARAPPRIEESIIPEEGVVLFPGRLYLAATLEHTHTPFHVPILEGRSSMGRLGVRIHATAGLGDVGFRGTWTLEIDVVHPVRIYAGMRLCQIMFVVPRGELRQYTGRYQDQSKPAGSRMHLPGWLPRGT